MQCLCTFVNGWYGKALSVLELDKMDDEKVVWFVSRVEELDAMDDDWFVSSLEELDEKVHNVELKFELISKLEVASLDEKHADFFTWLVYITLVNFISEVIDKSEVEFSVLLIFWKLGGGFGEYIRVGKLLDFFINL